MSNPLSYSILNLIKHYINLEALHDDQTDIPKLNKIPHVLFNDITIPNNPKTNIGNNP